APAPSACRRAGALRPWSASAPVRAAPPAQRPRPPARPCAPAAASAAMSGTSEAWESFQGNRKPGRPHSGMSGNAPHPARNVSKMITENTPGDPRRKTHVLMRKNALDPTARHVGRIWRIFACKYLIFLFNKSVLHLVLDS